MLSMDRRLYDYLEDADYFMYVKIYSNITFVKNEYKEQIYSL